MRRSTTTLASPHRPAFPSTRRTPRASAASVLHQALPHLAASKPAQSFDRPGSSCAVPTPSERLRPPGKLPPYTATRAVSRPPQAAPCTALQTTHSAPVSTKSAAPATPPPSASRSALLAASVPSIAPPPNTQDPPLCPRPPISAPLALVVEPEQPDHYQTQP